MEKITTKRLALYSGRTHPALAAEVADALGMLDGLAWLGETQPSPGLS